MPYKLTNVCEDKTPHGNSKCYYVEAKDGKRLSKKPLTKVQARKQRIAVILNSAEDTGNLKSYFI